MSRYDGAESATDLDIIDETGKFLCPICQTYWDDIAAHDRSYHASPLSGIRDNDRVRLEITNEEGEIYTVLVEVLSDQDHALSMLQHPVPTETVRVSSIERPTYYPIG